MLVGATAGRLTFWPGLRTTDVEGASRKEREPQPGFRFHRRLVPPELVLEQHGLRLSVPALTAVDLCQQRGGEAIDQALRTRAATLDGMWEAFRLTARRRGHRDRRALLLDSRDEPWSEAERLCHRLLRGAGLTGWRANLPVRVEGRTFFLDVAFPAHPVVVEIDGRSTTSTPRSSRTTVTSRTPWSSTGGWSCVHLSVTSPSRCVPVRAALGSSAEFPATHSPRGPPTLARPLAHHSEKSALAPQPPPPPGRWSSAESVPRAAADAASLDVERTTPSLTA